MMYMSYIICCFYIACKISYQIYQEKNIKKREFKIDFNYSFYFKV